MRASSPSYSQRRSLPSLIFSLSSVFQMFLSLGVAATRLRWCLVFFFCFLFSNRCLCFHRGWPRHLWVVVILSGLFFFFFLTHRFSSLLLEFFWVWSPLLSPEWLVFSCWYVGGIEVNSFILFRLWSTIFLRKQLKRYLKKTNKSSICDLYATVSNHGL